MSVLVTGASGRVGRAVWVRLARTGPVAGLDRAPSSTAQWVGELDDEALLERALAGRQALVHTAALHAPQVGRVPDAEFERINVAATRRLLRCAAAAGVRQVVYTSTTALYGAASTPPGRAGWVDEDTPPAPRDVYHRSKLAAEAVLAEAASAHGLAVTVLRMSRCFPEPASAMAVYRLHRGVDARDVAAAHALALARPGPPGQVRCFVVSGATPFLPEDAPALWQDAAAVLRQRAPDLVAAFAARGWALPARIDRVYDPARARAVLGWAPRHGWDAVLRALDACSSEVLPPAWPAPSIPPASAAEPEPPGPPAAAA
ncbi:UDP-glucose 4-epimerase [Piscinibacter sakaiensis]|uniref:UDP-glucose 4-epimerase n=1 Tax=Piscinibacter sakaiensis TaxID=1547922 RepID=A0A0K8NZZ6_PISS1|nr:NAD(P)-dependent oxidoreductase [Piscinibacter sakaiensis]GAP35956.1 UDP-glucose 4-epimerase [Piscinibacter sakaiensis]